MVAPRIRVRIGTVLDSAFDHQFMCGRAGTEFRQLRHAIKRGTLQTTVRRAEVRDRSTLLIAGHRPSPPRLKCSHTKLSEAVL
jgi:hypothetical protein